MHNTALIIADILFVPILGDSFEFNQIKFAHNRFLHEEMCVDMHINMKVVPAWKFHLPPGPASSRAVFDILIFNAFRDYLWYQY
jgi:hypothetical protein